MINDFDSGSDSRRSVSVQWRRWVVIPMRGGPEPEGARSQEPGARRGGGGGQERAARGSQREPNWG